MIEIPAGYTLTLTNMEVENPPCTKLAEHAVPGSYVPLCSTCVVHM